MSVDSMIAAGHNDARTGNAACVFSEGTAAHAAWMIGFNGYYAGRSVEALHAEAEILAETTMQQEQMLQNLGAFK